MKRYYLLQTDNHYMAHMLVTALSVRHHAPAEEESVFYVIDDGLSDENRARGRDFSARYACKVIFLDGRAMSASLRALGVPPWRGGYTTYLKLFALDEIRDADRVLYLDSDVIVKRDISSVFDCLDRTDAPLAMAEDMTVSFRAAYKKYLFGEGGEHVIYYNAGVILFDLPRWREYGCEKRVLEFIQSDQKRLMYCEQDILNILFRGRIETLSNTYNYCTPLLFYHSHLMGKLFGWDGAHTRAYDALSDQYAIGHCFAVLGDRPWHTESIHPLASDYRALYEEIFKKTFKGTPAAHARVTLAQRVLYRVCRPLYVVLHRYATKRSYARFIQNATREERGSYGKSTHGE